MESNNENTSNRVGNYSKAFDDSPGRLDEITNQIFDISALQAGVLKIAGAVDPLAPWKDKKIYDPIETDIQGTTAQKMQIK